MILSQAIKELFPNVNFEVDVILRDEGDGVVYIAFWGLLDPQPSEAELEAAWLSVVAKQVVEDAKQAARKDMADDAKDLHEILEGKEWTTEEIKEIIEGILDRLDFLDFLEPLNG